MKTTLFAFFPLSQRFALFRTPFIPPAAVGNPERSAAVRAPRSACGRLGTRCLFWFWALVLLAVPVQAVPETVPPAGIGPSPELNAKEALRQRVEMVLETERQNLAAMREKLDEMTAAADRMQTRLDDFDIQMAAHRNLFLVDETPLSELERAWVEHQTALKTVGEFIAAGEENLSWIQEQQREIQSRAELSRADLDERLTNRPDDAEKTELMTQLDRAEEVMVQKLELLGTARQLYGERLVPRLREFQARLSGFTKRFDTRLRERKARKLFERETTAEGMIQSIRTLMDPTLIAQRAKSVLQREIGILSERIRGGGYFFLVAFLLLFGSLEFVAARCRRGCYRIADREELGQRPWARMTLRIFGDGLPLFAATFFLYGYAKIRGLWLSTEIFRLAFTIVGVWLVTQWFFSFLKRRREVRPEWISPFLEARLRNLLRLFRWGIPALLLLVWLMGRGMALLVTVRLIFDLVVLIWIVRFWKEFQTEHSAGGDGAIFVPSLGIRAIRGISFLIPLVGLLLVMLGFNSLGLYWSTSWFLTFQLLLWGGLLFQVIREWRERFQAVTGAPSFIAETQPYRSFRWLMIQVAWMAWGVAGLLVLLFAWYIDKDRFFEQALALIRAPLPVEGLQISLFSLLSAVLFLLLIHVAVRTWTPVFRDRFLADSGLDRGARNSVSLIVVYGLWAVGILMALNILGVQTTHLAVVFGALGLGLGFGLQNIFNNFISGIILLFERPIQVGDVVEINGTWAEVKNINVRATQVQTYDNASLLIPNSEFVSSTVTNWSFKDLRIRRNIYVGVAYGSDIARVRDTILEIADTTEHVLKYPKPLVYFTDFADSALIFRLRFWTDVDNCLTAETDIRFAIDRLFRERGIEIAFPQRDVHIRTIPENLFSHAPNPAAPTSVAGAAVTMDSPPVRSDPSPVDDSGDDPNPNP